MIRSALCMVAAVSAAAIAGPEWPEVGDAGSLPASAQHVTGKGPLAKISGELTGPAGLPHRGHDDFQDMYLINIAEPFAFMASTNFDNGGFAAFDSQLWLFNFNGLGLLASQNDSKGSQSATLTNVSNDGTEVVLTEPGLYYLAITGAGSNPFAGPNNEPIFLFDNGPGEVSGPDGPGGTQPVSGWTEPGAFGVYEISLHGCTLILPSPAAPLVVSTLGLLAIRRRR